MTKPATKPVIKEKNDFKVVESSVLESLMAGSYEKRMQILQKEVRTKMGDGVALVASFPGQVTLVEGAVFFSMNYKIGDNDDCEFSNRKEIDIPLLDESRCVSSVVGRFLEEGKLSDFSELVIQSMRKQKSASQIMSEQIGKLFESRGWNHFLDENRDEMTRVSFDRALGSFKHSTIKKKFVSLVESGDIDSERKAVIESLDLIGSHIMSFYEAADSAFNSYKLTVGGFERTADLELIEKFMVFSKDYLEHLRLIGGFVSESLDDVDEGNCVLCGAMAHDAVAERAQDLELASRLIRKVSKEFAQNYVQEGQKK